MNMHMKNYMLIIKGFGCIADEYGKKNSHLLLVGISITTVGNVIKISEYEYTIL